MKKTWNTLILYLKTPNLEADLNIETFYRLRVFCHLLLICFLSAIITMIPIGIIEELGWVDIENHAIEKMLEKSSKLYLLFFAVIIAPLLEELFFRGPIPYFKNPKTFRFAFYGIALLFAFIHLSNYQVTTSTILLAPLLVLPQFILGLYLGFIRVRFGLLWSMLLHGSYNLIVFVLFLIGTYG